MKQYYFIFFFLIFTFTHSQTYEVVAGILNSGGYSGDGGPSVNAQLNYPRHLIFDNVGNLFFADENNHCIRKVDTNGIISTVIGNGTLGYSGDGGSATSAQLNKPRGIYIDSNNFIYVADTGNNAIRKIDNNGIITTIAGNGVAGFYGDGGPATTSMLNSPRGISIDDLDNIYISDLNNNRVRKIDTNGIITTIAGGGAVWPNIGGLATDTYMEPYYAIEKNGFIWIVDVAGVVRKVNSSGLITFHDYTVQSPTHIDFDNNDNAYITSLTGGIYKIDSEENITLVFDMDIYSAGGLTFDTNFNLIYSETFSNQVRKYENSTLGSSDLDIEKIIIYPNPTKDKVTIKTTKSIRSVKVYDINGRFVLEQGGNINTGLELNLSSLTKGMYFVNVQADSGSETVKVVKE